MKNMHDMKMEAMKQNSLGYNALIDVKWCFFFQFWDVVEVAIIHKYIKQNLVIFKI
jgi:hypothetical protein